MEPRSAERGNRPRRGQPRRGQPRFNGATLSRTWKQGIFVARLSAANPLQWSHAQPNVETRMHWTWGRAQRRLQWSHAQPNVETWHRSQTPICGSRCFNGATLSRTWKQEEQSATNPLPHCFNGATLSRTWKPAVVGNGQRSRLMASMEPRSAERGNIDSLRFT